MKAQGVRNTVLSILASVILSWGMISIYQDTRGLEVNSVIFDSNQNLRAPIKLVFISDLHLTGSDWQFERLKLILDESRSFSPDLILLGGDFIGAHNLVTLTLIDEILLKLQQFSTIAPTYSVLGNHEWWTSNSWRSWLIHAGINVIEGRVEPLRLQGTNLCIRGLGDVYTGHYRSIPFTSQSIGMRITLTHDPDAIERDSENGLYFAGHTHCGQIRLPFIYPSWVPTGARPVYTCGIGSVAKKVWLTTSGVGTSVVPIRMGAPASIELITII